MRVEISLDGCDASTEWEMDVSAEEFAFLSKLSKLSEKASTYGCEPTMMAVEVTP